MNSGSAASDETIAPGIAALKQRVRVQSLELRRRQPDRAGLSRAICARLLALPQFARAATLMCYVGVRTEVDTSEALTQALAERKTLVVPWCSPRGELELFRLERLDELAEGSFHIPEPTSEVRSHAERRVSSSELNLVVVPGVAFTVAGARLGHGRGYFDRLLAQVRPDAPLVGLAFECQIVPELPEQPHDIPMDLVVTERAVYTGRGRGSD